MGENKPVAIRYPKDIAASEDFVRSACAEPFELGKSVVVKSSADSAIAIVAYGSVLTEALEAARLLEQDGIEVDVINARFAAPVDEKIALLPGEGKGIITVEDHRLACGFGSAVLELAAEKTAGGKPADSRYDKRKGLNAIRTLGMPKSFIKHDSRSVQLVAAGINAEKIAMTAKKMLMFI